MRTVTAWLVATAFIALYVCMAYSYMRGLAIPSGTR